MRCHTPTNAKVQAKMKKNNYKKYTTVKYAAAIRAKQTRRLCIWQINNKMFIPISKMLPCWQSGQYIIMQNSAPA